jgi:putative nucleotidyltransferase with HDIG domain
MKYPSRDQALEILHEHTQGDGLRKHAYAVEAAMRAYARRLGGDEEEWGAVGLLHDFDYEKHPSLEEHPFRGVEILRARGFDEDFLRAILSHAPHTGVEPERPIEKAVRAVDELCGFIVAVALVRPNKTLSEVEVRSVKKKMKDKAFARNVNRDDIRTGAELMGLSLEEHIGLTLEALKGSADRLDLAGPSAG